MMQPTPLAGMAKPRMAIPRNEAGFGTHEGNDTPTAFPFVANRTIVTNVVFPTAPPRAILINFAE